MSTTHFVCDVTHHGFVTSVLRIKVTEPSPNEPFAATYLRSNAPQLGWCEAGRSTVEGADSALEVAARIAAAHAYAVGGRCMAVKEQVEIP